MRGGAGRKGKTSTQIATGALSKRAWFEQGTEINRTGKEKSAYKKKKLKEKEGKGKY